MLASYILIHICYNIILVKRYTIHKILILKSFTMFSKQTVHYVMWLVEYIVIMLLFTAWSCGMHWINFLSHINNWELNLYTWFTSLSRGICTANLDLNWFQCKHLINASLDDYRKLQGTIILLFIIFLRQLKSEGCCFNFNNVI